MSAKTRIIDSDSDSDDNIPLAQLRSNVVVKPEPVVKAEPKVEPVATNGGVKRAKDDDSDSDDNIPISSLAKRIKAEPTATKPTTTASGTARTQQQKKKKRVKIKFKQQECTEELYGTLKGRLVQELLCRWWYAIEWPSVDTKKSHPHSMQELDGFRGSFIRVKGDEMGSIVDTRNQVGKPSFIHFFALPSAEIQKLLITAYEKQMEVLQEHEGPNAPLLKDLKSALASASKISPDKADRSVTKILKKYKELGDQITEIQEKAMQEDNTGTEEEEDTADDDDDD